MSPSMRYYDSDFDSTASHYSGRSYQSQSTAPTSYAPASRRSLRYSDVQSPELDAELAGLPAWGSDPRASTETYASTIPSEEDYLEDVPEYEVPEYHPEPIQVDPISCTPPEFAELFPSTRRMTVRHDDMTEDGNMNLRVDTAVTMSDGRRRDFTLFHLRMYDLKRREFSLRRYCRDSGREVCHTTRKYTKPAAERRPTLQRSMSHALASLRSSKLESRETFFNPLKRHDSGYESDEVDSADGKEWQTGTHMALPTNTTKLEFSNYAQVNVKRRGTKATKRYEFEYWGRQYLWRRVTRKEGSSHETSYHLIDDTGASLAHIVPVSLTSSQAHDEEAKGGWVAPCSMWISDEKILSASSDVADVIVSTGLIALVDDCIKRRFHSKRSVQVVLPITSRTSLKVDAIHPKRLVDEVFHRRSSSNESRHPTPLRQTSARA